MADPAILSIAVSALSITCFGLVVSLVHLRRRHRALRHTLTRVAHERDMALWQGRAAQ